MAAEVEVVLDEVAEPVELRLARRGEGGAVGAHAGSPRAAAEHRGPEGVGLEQPVQARAEDRPGTARRGPTAPSASPSRSSQLSAPSPSVVRPWWIS